MNSGEVQTDGGSSQLHENVHSAVSSALNSTVGACC